MSEALTTAVVKTLRAMRVDKPSELLDDVQFYLRKSGDVVDEAGLVQALVTDNVNDDARVEFHLQLSKWDGTDAEEWAAGTDPHTQRRRDRILELLGLSHDARVRLNATFPVGPAGAAVISDAPADWDPWYRKDDPGHTFYWDGYRSVLAKKMEPLAVANLDSATDEVMRRLADPTRAEPYMSKGLVVGHVQSGKTANFTGVIAKAIDAGYRLVIVLTGTIEILRSQTQRRVDMELVGEENIHGGYDPNNPEQVKDVDYIGDRDRDWLAGRFIRYGHDPKDLGQPNIRRLTRSRWDFRRLQAGLDTLDFRQTDVFADRARPLYDPVNLFGTDVRLAVVKKNASVLTKLVKDLRAIRTSLAEIPTLIIDDEADQASINTVNPKRQSAETKQRTAINRLLAQLLRELPRAQYVGYTATPFANVFVDPDDSEDIFPKDFIVSLRPPEAYMGGRDFHDLDRDVAEGDDPGTFATSNEKAYVRDLVAAPDDEHGRRKELRDALDAYVLSGAIKLHRADALGKPDLFRHHTMLVHESVKQVDHEELARTIRDVWRGAGYSSPGGMRRLHDLWRDDHSQVTAARASEEPTVGDFSDLRPFIGRTVDRISRGLSPVVIVNGASDRDYEQDDIDFQGHDVWKILVGGAKLSRGFTVEGLTVSYYTRRTTAADTLMQMGRWFGFRPHYSDLVRLYIGRNVPGPRGQVVDLYEAFGAIVRDEEDFRDELERFQGLDEVGRPRVRPMDVPPLVYQSLPFLKPTSTNKMYNTELAVKGEGGRVQDFFQQPEHSAEINRQHFAAVQPLLAAARDTGRFFHVESVDGRVSYYTARYGLMGAEELLDVVEQFRWAKNYNFTPTTQFMLDAIKRGTLKDWVVVVPELSGASVRPLTVGDQRLHVLKRSRRADRSWVFSGSSPRQRDALEVLAGRLEDDRRDRRLDVAADVVERPEFAHMRALRSKTRGSFLLTFAADRGRVATDPADLDDPSDPADIASLFSLAMPWRSAPDGRIGFRAKKDGAGAIIDAD